MAPYETVDYRQDGRIAIIALNRPAVRNAINEQLGRELGAAWRQFRDAADSDVAIVTGASEAFCVGADMKEMAAFYAARDEGEETADQPLGGAEARAFGPRHQQVGKPVICAVNGLCAGIGLTFVTQSDIVIGSERAAFTDPHVSWGGISTEVIRLAMRTSFSTVLRLGLLGKAERLSARQALLAGLISEVTAPENLLPRAMHIAREILAASQPAVRAQKEMIWRAMDRLYDDAIQAAGETGRRFSMESRDANIARGAAAFVEGHAPKEQA